MRGVTCPTFHAHCLSLVFLEAHPIKDARHFVKRSLKTGALWRRNKSVIDVEKSPIGPGLTFPGSPVWSPPGVPQLLSPSVGQERQRPCERLWLTGGQPELPRDVSGRQAHNGPRLCRHLGLVPVSPQDAERPGTHSILCQDIKTAVSIQGIVVIAKVD